jgi:hypothetical protein
MLSQDREFAAFVDSVGKYQLDERDQKTTAHTSAVSVRWDPKTSESAEESRRA